MLSGVVHRSMNFVKLLPVSQYESLKEASNVYGNMRFDDTGEDREI